MFVVCCCLYCILLLDDSYVLNGKHLHIFYSRHLHTDSIEANVESATIHVEEGTTSLRKAAELQVSKYSCLHNGTFLKRHGRLLVGH